MVLLVRSYWAAFAAIVLAVPLSAADPADEAACDPFQGHDTRTITRELITTIDISTGVPTTPGDFVTLSYEEAYQNGPSPATLGQHRHTEGFELRFDNGAPFAQGNTQDPAYVPVTERQTVRILLSARGAHWTAFEHLPARSGAAIGDESWSDAIEVIGEAGSFHGLSEITFPGRQVYNVEKTQVFVPSSQPGEIDLFMVCRRADAFPNPTCSLFLDQDPFDLKLSFLREFADDWRRIEQMSRNFVKCIYQE